MKKQRNAFLVNLMLPCSPVRRYFYSAFFG